MRRITFASTLLLAAHAVPAWNQQVTPKTSSPQSASDRSTTGKERVTPMTESQKKMTDQALHLSALAAQLHGSLQKMQNGEIAVGAIKQVREYVKLSTEMSQDAGK